MITQKNIKKKVLIADDDPAIVDSLRIMLEETGYDVQATLYGGEIKKMLTPRPDLLLLDIWMSGEDGRNICRNLKSDKSTKNIPIIMISANKDTAKISQESGADDFLSKPFEMQELLDKVEHYAKR